MLTPFLLDVIVYFVGLAAGVLASQVLDVQVRRPGLKLSIALVMLTVMLSIFLINTNSTMPEWLLLAMWLGIGVLAGLGSRNTRTQHM